MNGSNSTARQRLLRMHFTVDLERYCPTLSLLRSMIKSRIATQSDPAAIEH